MSQVLLSPAGHVVAHRTPSALDCRAVRLACGRRGWISIAASILLFPWPSQPLSIWGCEFNRSRIDERIRHKIQMNSPWSCRSGILHCSSIYWPMTSHIMHAALQALHSEFGRPASPDHIPGLHSQHTIPVWIGLESSYRIFPTCGM